MAGQQQEEIETIRSRTIEVKLSDADVKRISEKAAAHGLTVGELIENFIGDLVCGTYSNGSDERMYAEQWFERCWFGMFPDLTFLRYLIEWGGLDEVIGAWENIKSTEENIQTSEEALASGVMKGRGGRTYTWKDLTNGKGKELIEQIVADTNDKAKMEIMQFSGMDDKTLSGVFAELSNHITVFATSDDLQRALSGEGRSITPADIEGGYDIFCCIPEHKLEEWKDLLGMMCNQFLKSFERRGEGNKTPILFLIDEFPRLGKIEAISNGLATLRSKKIHIALIVQSKSQLDRMGQQKEIPTMGRLQYYQAEAEARRQLDTALKQEAQTRERNRTHDRDRGI